MVTSSYILSLNNYLRSINVKYIRKIRLFPGENIQFILNSDIGNLLVYFNPKKNILVPSSIRLTINTQNIGWIAEINKYIANSRIYEIYQPNLERILEFKLKSRSGLTLRLIIEAFGKGNIILTKDDDGVILSLNNRLILKDRVLDKGVIYKYPKVKGINPLSFSKNELISLILNGKEYVERVELYRKLCLDKYIISEALFRSGFYDVEKLYSNDIHIFIDKLLELLDITANRSEGYTVIRDGVHIEVLPFHLSYFKSLTSDKDRKVLIRDFDIIKIGDYLLDNYLLILEDKKKKSELDKLSRRLGSLIETVSKYESRINMLKSALPKLYERINELDICFSKLRSGEVPEGYEVDLKNRVVFINVNGVKIPLKYELNPYSAISEAYNIIKKDKEVLKNLRNKINEITSRIESLKQSICVKVGNYELVKYRKKEWYEVFKWFKTSKSGLLVIGGRDSKTNERLIKYYLEDKDLVFHSDYYGSPFVIIKNGQNACEKDLYEAAIFTASHSRAWRDGLHSLDVYYVYPDQVSKRAPSGEYLKTGAFMIHGKRNYIRGVPLKLWIGLHEDTSLFYIAPEDSVKKYCVRKLYIEIYPGDLEKNTAVKEIVDVFINKGVLKVKNSEVSYYYQDLISKLPPGSLRYKIIP